MVVDMFIYQRIVSLFLIGTVFALITVSPELSFSQLDGCSYIAHAEVNHVPAPPTSRRQSFS
jgi:hypothetical protein